MHLKWLEPRADAEVEEPLPTGGNALMFSFYIWLLALMAYATVFIFRIVPSWTR